MVGVPTSAVSCGTVLDSSNILSWNIFCSRFLIYFHLGIRPGRILFSGNWIFYYVFFGKNAKTM